MGWVSVAKLTAAKALLLRNADVAVGAGVSCPIAVCTNARIAAQSPAVMLSLRSSAKQALTPHPPAAVCAAALFKPGGMAALLGLLLVAGFGALGLGAGLAARAAADESSEPVQHRLSARPFTHSAQVRHADVTHPAAHAAPPYDTESTVREIHLC